VSMLQSEYQRACKAVLQITRHESLLSNLGWLQRSIRSRNPYIDPLNDIQVELLRRLRAAQAAGDDTELIDQLAALLRLSVQGIASGMRTTG